MKLKKISVIIFLLIQINCIAQKDEISNNKENYLSITLEKYKNIENENDIQKSINEIKRIEALDSSYWLPSYYISYMEIKQSFLTKIDKKKENLLENAKLRIEKLLSNPSADKSELYTVLGYYYYAKIAQNPSENGQLYYKKVIDNYQKAIKINSKNPRPNYLLLLFEENMNRFFNNTNSDFCEKLKDNKRLFEEFEVIDKNYPFWGEKELLNDLKKCAKSN